MPDFLGFFYRIFAGLGLLGVVAGFLIAGMQGGLGFLAGFLSMAFVLWLWDRITARIIKPRKANVIFESILFFLRFILLAGLFYAMIRLFAVSPAWYAAGMAALLPGVVLAGLLHKDDDAERDGSVDNGES